MADADWLTVPEVAERVRHTTMTIYRWIEAGKLPAVKVGKEYRIRAGDLDDLLEHARVGGGGADPWGPEPTTRPARGRAADPVEQRRQAISMNQAAAAQWAEAMRAHILAPPDAGFPARLQALAEAARSRARAARVADAAGLAWAAQPNAVDSQPPYELRLGTGRTGPAELWGRFDVAVAAYNEAIAGSFAGAVADAADALAVAAEEIARAHGQTAATGSRARSAP